MFRHAIKKCCYVHRLPRNDSLLQLYKLPRNGCLQIYITSILRQQQRGAGSSRDLKPCPPVKSKKKYYYTLGILLVGAAGVIGYAKYDPDFRQVLTEAVPAADGVIKFVFEEEKSYKDNINDMYNYLKERTNQIYANLLDNSDKLEDTQAKPKEAEKQPQEKPPSGIESGEKAVEKEETETEKALKSAAQTLILAISTLQDVIRDEAESISKLVDESVRTDDPSTIWTQIDEITESKKSTIDEAEKKYQLVKSQYEKRRSQLPSQNNVKSTLDEVAGALKALELEKAHLAAALKFAQEVENLRGRINRELKTLFPNLKLAEKSSKLTLPEVDLFMLYAYNTISNFQQEIKKLDAARDAKLREIVERTKANIGNIDARIEQELQKERANFEQEFEKRKAEIEENCEKDVMEQFKRQTLAHHKVLEEALYDKEVEIEKRMEDQLMKQYEEEKKKYDSSLLAMVSKMKVLNEAVETQGSPWAGGLPRAEEDAIDRMKQEKKADQARELWAACQELSKALKASKTDDSEPELKPLEKYIKLIKTAAVKGDDFVDSVIASIPRKAICRGVFSEDMLRDRFEKVEKVAKRVAQVPEGGTSLPLVFLAFLQSLFIVQAIEPIPSHELANQPIDTAKLNNFDILQRARYWMERGDFEQALRYMNLLKGGAKAVAKDWMEETTILLETQQAANVLKAYAIASGLIYL